MQQRKLGNTNIQVSALGLGCMGMSEFYGPVDTAEATATLLNAVESGINFFDTADVYGSGANEKLVGEVLKPFRQQIFLATKFGIVRDPQDSAARGINGRPEYVRADCDASLQRLNIESIDLYYLHRVDKNVPIEETFGAMAELVRAGKVRYLGISEANVNTIKRAHAVHPITAVQSEFSLFTRERENDVIPLCEQLNITFVPYSPLGRGILTQQTLDKNTLSADDFRRSMPRFSDENFARNIQLVDSLKNYAKQKNCSATQLALAWVLAKSPNIVPIPGTRRRKYLQENIGALNVQLASEDITYLDNLFKPELVAGKRYHDLGMQLVDL